MKRLRRWADFFPLCKDILRIWYLTRPYAKQSPMTPSFRSSPALRIHAVDDCMQHATFGEEAEYGGPRGHCALRLEIDPWPLVEPRQ